MPGNAPRSGSWRPTKLRRMLASALLTAAVVPTASVAAVRQAPPPGPSAVQAYVEDVPRASGQSPSGHSSSSGQTLAPAAKGALRGASPALAAALATVATSPAYGAPQTGSSSSSASPSNTSLGGSLESTADAIGGASDARLLGLVVVLIATTVVAIGVAVRRARP